MSVKTQRASLTEAQTRTVQHMLYVIGWTGRELSSAIGVHESAVSRLLSEGKPLGRDAQAMLAVVARPYGCRFLAEVHDPVARPATNGTIEDEIGEGITALGMARDRFIAGKIGEARRRFAELMDAAYRGMAECDLAEASVRAPVAHMNRTLGAVRSPAS